MGSDRVRTTELTAIIASRMMMNMSMTLNSVGDMRPYTSAIWNEPEVELFE